jgi:hypothetical protein
MTRNIKVYPCQEPAIVSKPAGTRKTSDTIYESPVFLFRTRIDQALEKAQATLQGYILQTFNIRKIRLGRPKEACLAADIIVWVEP